MQLVSIRWMGVLFLSALLSGCGGVTHATAPPPAHINGVWGSQPQVVSDPGLKAAMIAQMTQAVHTRAATHTRTFWLQTMDSCQEARPGAIYVLMGNGVRQVSDPGDGAKLLTVGRVDGKCPLQHGNCLKTPAGCVSWQIPIPSWGSQTYVIYQASGPPHFTPCFAGNSCEYIILTINSHGTITAQTHCVDPKGRLRLWPLVGRPFTGSQTDPAVFHNFYYR